MNVFPSKVSPQTIGKSLLVACLGWLAYLFFARLAVDFFAPDLGEPLGDYLALALLAGSAILGFLLAMKVLGIAFWGTDPRSVTGLAVGGALAIPFLWGLFVYFGVIILIGIVLYFAIFK